MKNSVKLEESVIACMLLDEIAILKANEILEKEDFYNLNLGKYFEAINKLYSQGKKVDPLLLSEKTEEKEKTFVYLSGIANSIPTASLIEDYAKKVKEKSLLRKVIGYAAEVSFEAEQEPEDVNQFLLDTERKFFALSSATIDKSSKTFKDLSKDYQERLNYLVKHKGEIPPDSIAWGFKDLDKVIPITRDSYVVIGGRPSMGKTSLVIGLLEHAVLGQGIPTAIFSLEMSREQLMERLTSIHAEVDSQRMRTGYLTEEELTKITTGLGRMAYSKAPILFNDTPAITPFFLWNEARKLKKEFNIGLFIVDYLQLMHMDGKAESRTQEVTQISSSIKSLVRELKTPFVVVSQLSRAPEKRAEGRYRLSDLRESGAIEQDADIILFVSYNRETEIATLEIAKNRNGRSGDLVDLRFCPEFTKFKSLEKRKEGAYEEELK